MHGLLEPFHPPFVIEEELRLTLIVRKSPDALVVIMATLGHYVCSKVTISACPVSVSM
jgi:hypothetical protein